MQTAMIKNALPVTAFGEPAKNVLADVRENGKRLFLENDRPAFVLQTAEEYEKIIDLIEDMRIEQIAAERLSKPRGKGTSFEDALAEFGLTEENLKGWEDIEIE